MSCSKIFTSKQFNRHLKTHKNNPTKRIRIRGTNTRTFCRVCQRSDDFLQDLSEFKLHLLLHSEEELAGAGYDIKVRIQIIINLIRHYGRTVKPQWRWLILNSITKYKWRMS
jgi:hypothetical protein